MPNEEFQKGEGLKKIKANKKKPISIDKENSLNHIKPDLSSLEQEPKRKDPQNPFLPIKKFKSPDSKNNVLNNMRLLLFGNSASDPQMNDFINKKPHNRNDQNELKDNDHNEKSNANEPKLRKKTTSNDYKKDKELEENNFDNYPKTSVISNEEIIENNASKEQPIEELSTIIKKMQKKTHRVLHYLMRL